MTRSASQALRGANLALERCKNTSERCSVRRASKFCEASSGSSFAGGLGGGGGSLFAGTKKARPVVDNAGNGVKGWGMILWASLRSLQYGVCRSK
jgi:hypothetical protein